MWPSALTTAARARAGGPTIAIDLPGADAKVRATTIANQPAATKALAAAIRRNGRSPGERGRLPSIIIEVLDAHAPGLECPIDIDKAINPGPQAGPAEAGFGVEIQRKQLGRVLHVQRRRFRRDHGDENFVIAAISAMARP